MAGTATGGRLAAEKNKKRHGTDFYKRIGSIGGRNSRTGGFYANRELARRAGAKGGATSRRS
jgi:general stress protein YciG